MANFEALLEFDLSLNGGPAWALYRAFCFQEGPVEKIFGHRRQQLILPTKC